MVGGFIRIGDLIILVINLETRDVSYKSDSLIVQLIGSIQLMFSVNQVG